MDYDFAYKLAKKFANKYFKNVDCYVVGSIRRHAPTVKDIDFLIIGDDDTSYNIISSLSKNKNIKVLSSGNKKIMLTYYGKRVDIFFTSKSDLIPALLHFTGSKIFNIRMRQKAKQLGYTLNQYGLFDNDGNKIKLRNEKSVFKILGFDYKEPQDREH
jgi:DNA polymerase (family 10)